MEYMNQQWLQVLKTNSAHDFDSLWPLNEGDWFEEPNYRRGGWSGVCKAALTLADGSKKNVFIKRQENHFYTSWKHGFSKIPTFQREYQNIRKLQKFEIPTLDLVYFGTHVEKGKHAVYW